MGFLMQITTLVAQNSVAPQEMGVASSSRTFFQQIGGSLGVAAFGAVFARRLIESLTAHAPGLHMNVKGAPVQPGHGEPPARAGARTTSSWRSRTR